MTIHTPPHERCLWPNPSDSSLFSPDLGARSHVYLFADANVKTSGSIFEVLSNLDLLLRGLL
jgi:hypothetical protein